MEAAWTKRDVPPDIPGSPWRVGGALRDEFEAGWQARAAFSSPTGAPEREALRREAKDAAAAAYHQMQRARVAEDALQCILILVEQYDDPICNPIADMASSALAARGTQDG